MQSTIKYILFDVANTLIHKPLLWTRIRKVLEHRGIEISTEKLQYHHKFVSDFFDFPDRTNQDFYNLFNSSLLMSLGIRPDDILLDDIFANCTYLPWQAFEDTSSLKKLPVPIGVLSNFKTDLPQLLNSLFGDIFSDIIVSETVGLRKPNVDFYRYAINTIGIKPSEILYIGDSFKLDYIPADLLGMNSLLVDRISFYCDNTYTIRSLNQLHTYFA